MEQGNQSDNDLKDPPLTQEPNPTHSMPTPMPSANLQLKVPFPIRHDPQMPYPLPTLPTALSSRNESNGRTNANVLSKYDTTVHATNAADLLATTR